MECKFTSVSSPCKCGKIYLVDDSGNPLPRNKYDIVDYDCQSITIKIKDDATFSDEELKLLFYLTVDEIDNGGTPMKMGKYLDLYNKLGKLIERK